MNVLICGANGFIGSTLCAALEAQGHRVVKGVRRATASDQIAIDYTQDLQPEAWLPRLAGIDVAINAIGILNERGEQSYEHVHHAAPCALFEACGRAGVKRVIQISALGAQSDATAYFRSKHAADSFLQASRLSYQILRPSVVYGARGESSRMFRLLARLPVHVLPAGGHQLMRPVHVDDLAEAVVRLIAPEAEDRRVIELVGAEQVEYRDMLAIYRRSLGHGKPCRIVVPGIVVKTGVLVMDKVPGSMLTRDTWTMFEAGSTGDVAPLTALLGRAPRGVSDFIGR
jgi:uncharacterized protein YbjT (DUF2867 family)